MPLETARFRVGQTLIGALFNEPMRVETVAPAVRCHGHDPWRPQAYERRRRSRRTLHGHLGATTLDHVHAAMPLLSTSRCKCCPRLAQGPTQARPRFHSASQRADRVASESSDEKRLLHAMLLGVQR